MEAKGKWEIIKHSWRDAAIRSCVSALSVEKIAYRCCYALVWADLQHKV